MLRILLCVMCCMLVACERNSQPGSESPNSHSVDSPQPEEPSAITSQQNPSAQNSAQKPQEQSQLNGGNLAVVDISERNNKGKNGIAVTFNAAVDSGRDIQPYFAVSTESGDLVKGAWELDENRKQVWFMNTEPQTQYSIKVSPGLRADNGRHLLAAFGETLTTRRLQPSVNFDSNGRVLPVGYVSGLPVVTVNINEVDVDFFRIKDDAISDFVSQARSVSRSSWYARQLKNFGELMYSGRFDLSAPRNTRVKRDLDIKNIAQLREPGMYLAVMRAAGDYSTLEITWFSITDIGLHLRQYPSQMDVHVASLTTGKSIRDVALELRDASNRVLQTATTTPEGVASFTGNLNAAQVLVAKTKDQYTLLDLKQPGLDLSEFSLGDRPQLPNELFVYGPRDLYRPGEVVDFSALLRNHDGRLKQAPVLSAEIRNPLGAAVKTFKWQAQNSGYYQYAWQIAENAPTGTWQLVVQGTMSQAVVYAFHVEEFLPERMKLTLAEGIPRTLLASVNESVKVPLVGEYLYGAPAAGNKFDGLLQVAHWRSPVQQLKDFQFGDELDSGFTRQVKIEPLFLNSEGVATLAVESSWQEAHSPLEVRVVGSLYESGGRPVTRVHSVLVWPREILPGIRTKFGDSNPSPGSSAEFEVVLADVQGKLFSRKNVQATLVKEDRQYFWEYNQHRGWHWNWSEKEFAVATQTFATEDKQPVDISFPVEWGRYRLEVIDPETGIKSSVKFFAGRDWYHDWKNASNSIAARPDKITLALDKAHYNPGDLAELKILPPASGELLLLVESDVPLWSSKISVTEQGTSVKIPVNENWDSHNIYISALLLQSSGKKIRETPKRAMGLIHLPLNREARRLDVAVESPEKTLPGLPLQAIVRVPNAAPSETFVTLAAVDVGVLNITDFETPDPFEFFFGARRYTVDARDMYADVIEASQAEKAPLRFGGDADLVRGGTNPKSDVQIVSLYQGPVRIDAQGEARVTLNLPDFNGRLRLMALAFNDTSYGSADSETNVAAEVVTEIAMPRFLAYGDSAQVALDLHNTTAGSVDLEVALAAQAPLQLSQSKVSVALKPNEKTTLNFSVQATGFQGSAPITVQISSPQITDFQREWRLGVRPAYPAITKQLHRVLAPGEIFEVTPEDLSGVILETLQAAVSVSPVIDLQVGEQLRNLLAYPYGCLEQTSSRGWPLVYATQDQQKAFAMSPLSDAERFKRIQQAVDRILSFQRGNGSFGLWSGDAQEAHWLTVYATDFLLQARDSGVDVPEKQLNRALDRLQNYVNSSGKFVRQRWSRDTGHYAFATRAYAAFVLSRLQRVSLGVLRNLYQRDFNKAASGYSQLQLGLALTHMGDYVTGNEAISAALQNFNGEYRYWGDYGSNIRDLGMAIRLLAGEEKYKDAVFKMSLALRDAVRTRNWLSTQERFALFMAGMALQQNVAEPWKGSWKLGTQAAIPIQQKPAWLKNLYGSALRDGFQVSSSHSSPLYASAMLTGFGSQPPAPHTNGISIERRWYTLAGKPVTPKNVSTGELYLVHLVVTSDDRVADALVVNLLPAGFELENENLSQALNVETLQLGGELLSDLQKHTDFKHQEYRDDRYVAAIDQKGYRASHLVFVVRAVTPGEYQVPPALVEDMYRPEIRALGETLDAISITR